MDDFAISLDANDFVTGSHDVASAVDMLQRKFGAFKTFTEETVAVGDQLRLTLKGLTEAGEEVSATFNKTQTGWAAYKVSLKDAHTWTKELAKETRELAKAEQLAADAGAKARADAATKRRAEAREVADARAKERAEAASARQRARDELRRIASTPDQGPEYGPATNTLAALEAQNIHAKAMADKRQFDAIFQPAIEESKRKAKSMEAEAQRDAQQALKDRQKAAERAAVKAEQDKIRSEVEKERGGLFGGGTSDREFQRMLAVERAQAAHAEATAQAARLKKADPEQYKGVLGAMKGDKAALGGLNEAGHAVLRLNREAEAADRAIKNLDKSTNHLALSWESFGRYMVAHSAFSGVMQIGGMLREAVRDAGELQNNIALIQTLNPGSNREDWRKSIMGLSNKYGTDQNELAKAYYSAASNQIVELSGGEDPVKAIERYTEATQRFAQATGATAEQANNLFAGILQSYKMQASQVDALAAKMFKTIDLGRITAGEMSDKMGRIAVPASQLGISVDETLAMIDVLTQKGVKGSDAMTQILNVMNSLIKPSKELGKVFQSWGFESGEAAVKSIGLPEVMKRIQDIRYNSGLAEIGKMFNDIRAFRGVAGIVSDMDKFNDALVKTGNAASQYEEAVNTRMLTPAKKLQIELQKIQNELLVVADRAIEVAASANGVISLSDAFKALEPIMIGTITAGGIAMAAFVAMQLKPALMMTESLTRSFLGLQLATKASSMGVLAGVVGAAAVGFDIGSMINDAFKKDYSAEAAANAPKITLIDVAAETEHINRLKQSAADAAIQVMNQFSQANMEAANLYTQLDTAEKAYREEIKATGETWREVNKEKLEAIKEQVAATKAQYRSLEEAAQFMRKLTDKTGVDSAITGMGFQATEDILAQKLMEKKTEILGNKNPEDRSRLNQEFAHIVQLIEANRTKAGNVKETSYDAELERKIAAIDEKIQDAEHSRSLTRNDIQKHNEDIRAENARRKKEREEWVSKHKGQKVPENLRPLDSQSASSAKTDRDLIELKHQKDLLEQQLHKSQREAREKKDAEAKAKEEDAKNLQTKVDVNAQADEIAQSLEQQASVAKQVSNEWTEHLKATKLMNEAVQKYIKGLEGNVEASRKRSDEVPNVFPPMLMPAGSQESNLLGKAKANAFGMASGSMTMDSFLDMMNQFSTAVAGVGIVAAKSEEEVTKYGQKLVNKQRADTQDAKGRALSGALDKFSNVEAGYNEIASRVVAELKKAGMDEASARALASDPKRLSGLMGDLGQKTPMPTGLNWYGDKIDALLAEQAGKKPIGEDARNLSLNKPSQDTLIGDIAQLLTEMKKYDEAKAKRDDAIKESGDLKAFAPAVGTFKTAVDAFAETIKNIQPPTKAMGGHMAVGGQLGSDFVPTWLAPGEFVVNSAAAAQWRTQLMAINNRMAGGGSVQNINVGDVNVSLQSTGSSQQDALAIAKAVQREIRRGTVKI